MGAGALNWFPYYLSKKNFNVCIVECISNNLAEHVEMTSCHNLKIYTSQSDKIFHHLDSIFNVAKIFNPDLYYIFGRKDMFEFAYHIRHKYLSSKIVVDVRSPNLQPDNNENKIIEQKFIKMQYYIDKLFASDLDSVKTYTHNIFVDYKTLNIGVNCSAVKIANTGKKRTKPKKFVFIGNIFKKRKIDTLVDNFIKFAQHRDEVSLDIYGTGDALSKIECLVSQKSANKFISIKNAIPQELLFEKLCEYDAGIAYVPYDLYTVAPSLKSLEYSAAGIPVFASDTLGHKKLCQDYGFKFHLFSNNADQFVQDFINFTSFDIDKDMLEINLKAVKQFDWQSIANNLAVELLKFKL